MTDEGDMRMSELLGRVLDRQEVHSEQLKAIASKVDCLDRKVTQHRTGWQIFMWLGAAGIAAAGLFFAFVKS